MPDLIVRDQIALDHYDEHQARSADGCQKRRYRSAHLVYHRPSCANLIDRQHPTNVIYGRPHRNADPYQSCAARCDHQSKGGHYGHCDRHDRRYVRRYVHRRVADGCHLNGQNSSEVALCERRQSQDGQMNFDGAVGRAFHRGYARNLIAPPQRV